MLVKIEKSEISGSLNCPPSKSYTHRALILAALAKGKSKIYNPLICDDTEATIDALKEIGIKIEKKKDFLEIKGGKFLVPKRPLFCRESGTTLRLMAGICSLIKGKSILTGEKSLLKRPMEPLLNALSQLGVKCSLNSKSIIIENNFTPHQNFGWGFLGGKVEIPGNISSQFISSLLIISPLAKKEVEIKLITPLESKPYVLMTIEAQKKFGVKVNYSKDLRKFWIKRQEYKPTKYFVEGDWSSVAPFLATGVLAGKIKIKNLNLKSLQGDKEILNILKRMGTRIKLMKNGIFVEKSKLKAIKVDLRNFPDLFPIVCVLASAAKGESKILGIERLKFKESNRIKEMEIGLKKIGIKSYLKKNRFFIEGGEIKGGKIISRDHRILMTFAILGLISENEILIENAECVSKSFPEFFKVLRSITLGR